MDSNPYSSPAAPVLAPPHQVSPAALVPAQVIDQLAGTRPWVRLLSILTFIGSGFMALGAIGMLLMGGMATAFSTPTNSGLNGGVALVGAAAFYVLLAALCVYPGVKLWMYANRISLLMASRSEIDLEAALREQRMFWKFAAFSIVGLFVLFFLGAVAAAFFGAAPISR